jgi:hypothetical protein
MTMLSDASSAILLVSLFTYRLTLRRIPRTFDQMHPGYELKDMVVILNKMHKFNYTIFNGIAHQAIALCKCSPSITKDIKYNDKNK